MFYIIQYKHDIWLSTNMVVRGDFHKHLVLLEQLHKKYPFNTYRLKRITEDDARQLEEMGYVIYTAPEKLNDV